MALLTGLFDFVSTNIGNSVLFTPMTVTEAAYGTVIEEDSVE